MKKTLSGIKAWAEEDRPREKMMLRGKQALTDSELLAILLGTGNRNMTAVALAKEILKSANNDLNTLGKKTIEDFKEFLGIGEAKAITIMAAMELGRRRQLTQVRTNPRITSSQDAYNVLGPSLIDLGHEEFWVMYLNANNEVKRTEQISIGGTRATVADPKKILKTAILENAITGIILMHNHPSGNLKPSQADINLTKQILSACKAIDVRLLDHLIVSERGFYSFMDEGLI